MVETPVPTPAPVRRLYAPGPRAASIAAAAEPALVGAPTAATAAATNPAAASAPRSAAAGPVGTVGTVGPVAMPDQIVLRRTAAHGRRASALASGFGGDTPIQPASVTTMRSAPTAVPGTSGATRAAGPVAPMAPMAPVAPAAKAAPVIRRSPVVEPGERPRARVETPGTESARTPAPPPGFASGAWAPLPAGPPVPRAGQVAGRVAGSPVSPTAPGSPAAPGSSAAAAGVARAPGRTVPGARTAPSTSILRRLTVAPPRVSVNPASGPAGSGASPPVPAVARRSPAAASPAAAPASSASSTSPTSSASSAAGGGSLLDRSAHLFAELDRAAGNVIHRRLQPTGGTSMTESSLVPAAPPALAVPMGEESPVTGDDPITAESEKARFDRLVDAVVDRIEQRVVDELERRGRRQDWKVF